MKKIVQVKETLTENYRINEDGSLRLAQRFANESDVVNLTREEAQQLVIALADFFRAEGFRV